jgi:hypothetical protein
MPDTFAREHAALLSDPNVRADLITIARTLTRAMKRRPSAQFYVLVDAVDRMIGDINYQRLDGVRLDD